MITLTVEDMTCGGCVASITRVVKNLDAAATVSADVASKRVTVESQKDVASVIAAISGAGFHPVLA
jgi:copper chaperone CopZ